MNTATGHTPPSLKKPTQQTVPELHNYKYYQPPKQSRVESSTEPISIFEKQQRNYLDEVETVQQILNCCILLKNHPPHQRDLSHNFVNFRSGVRGRGDEGMKGWGDIVWENPRCDLRFADDIKLIAGTYRELKDIDRQYQTLSWTDNANTEDGYNGK